MHRRVVLALGLLLCVPAIAQAASAIVVGNHVLLAETPNQSIQLFITGDIQAGAVDLYQVINGGVGPAPLVTGIDLATGTVFAAGTGTAIFPAPDNVPGLTPAALNTSSAATPAGWPIMNGLLATVTFSTVGVPANVYSWSLTSHPNGPTDLGVDANFDVILPDITNGTLTVVPEPASVVMGLFAAAGIGAVAIRKRRARRA